MPLRRRTSPGSPTICCTVRAPFRSWDHSGRTTSTGWCDAGSGGGSQDRKGTDERASIASTWRRGSLRNAERLRGMYVRLREEAMLMSEGASQAREREEVIG